MTTTTTADQLEPVDQAVDPADDQGVDVDLEPQPRQADVLDHLTIAELDAGSRQLGTSLVQQIVTQGERYEQALAVTLWLHRRRTDRSTEPNELLRQLRQLRFSELQQQLTELSEQLAANEDGDPLASRPE